MQTKGKRIRELEEQLETAKRVIEIQQKEYRKLEEKYKDATKTKPER